MASRIRCTSTLIVAGRIFFVCRTPLYPHGHNFLLTILRLGRERDRLNVVNDQHGAPTSSIELADVTRAIVEGALADRFGAPAEWAGLYHMTCSGSTTWYGFAQAIFARGGRLLDGHAPQVNPIPAADYPTPAKRPHNSVLSNASLNNRFGLQLAAWETALDDVIDELSRVNPGTLTNPTVTKGY
jgi:dTDP-4-dehydrorhamnose reductase